MTFSLSSEGILFEVFYKRVQCTDRALFFIKATIGVYPIEIPVCLSLLVSFLLVLTMFIYLVKFNVLLG